VTASGAGFHSLTTEVHDHYPTVEGTIPEWLSGTLVRNGPARFEAGDRRVNHWFDGLAISGATRSPTADSATRTDFSAPMPMRRRWTAD